MLKLGNWCLCPLLIQRQLGLDPCLSCSDKISNLSIRKLTDTQIADFVRARETWIQSKLSLNKKRAETPVPQFEHGSCWQYRGRTVSLELSLGSNSVVLESDRLRVQSKKMGVRYLRTVLKAFNTVLR